MENQHVQRRRWIVPGASIAIAILAATTIYGLRFGADRAVSTLVNLSQFERHMAQLDGIEENAVRHGPTDDVLGEIAALDRSAQQVLEALAETDQKLPEIRDAYLRYREGLIQEMKLLQQGNQDVAEDVDDDIVDPQFEQIALLLQARVTVATQTSKTANQIANLGTLLALATAALSISAVFQRVEKANRRIAVTLAEKEAIEQERARLEERVAERTEELSQKTAELRQKNASLTQTVAELQVTQQELIQSEKMAALGTLVAGIAHEINTPLGAIQAAVSNMDKALDNVVGELTTSAAQYPQLQQAEFSEFLQQVLQSKPLLSSREKRPRRRALQTQLESYDIQPARSLADRLVDIGIEDDIDPYLTILQHENRDWLLQLAYDLNRLYRNRQTIQGAAKRAGKIVFALKNYARFDTSGELQSVQLKDGLETIFELYYNQLKQGIEVIRNYQPLPDVDCYPDELMQVWNNIIHNAIQAMPGQGTLTLSTSVDVQHAIVQISDTGMGIPPEIQAHIFDPFFTTKPVGEGSGLGLHISKQIIEKHDGIIHVSSQPGQTTFTISLPLSPTPLTTANSGTPASGELVMS